VAVQQAALANAFSTEPLGEGAEQQLVLNYGIALAKAELAWLEEIVNQLSKSAQQPLVMDVLVGDSAASTI